MIEQLKDVPANIACFRATGEVTKEDFKKVLVPGVERLLDRIDKINFILILDTDVKDFSAGAWLQDAMLGLRHLLNWNRASIVTDSEGVKKFTNAFSVVVPGEFRGFSKSELQQAIDWTSEKN